MNGFDGAGIEASVAYRARGEPSRFADDVMRGLSAVPRSIPPKWLYDARGSALFELVCEQPEYYLTRVETDLLERHGRDVASAIGADALVFEYGAGSARKTARLLASLTRPVAYVPVDISRDSLFRAVEELGEMLPRLAIRPVVADFTTTVSLPMADLPAARRVAFFPGSTVGNLEPPEAVALLARMAHQAGHGGALLIGVDLPKEEGTLLRAYDDAAGVTAAFDLNLLARINRELDGHFRLSAFRHRALWNARLSRVEMHLESRERQSPEVAGVRFAFETGETVHTENAYKWEPRSFDALAAIAGWRPERTWADERAWFALKLYRAA